ncbi:MAG: ATP-binding protein, partial [Magnetovibrio sp.]|nr:ATP-binding protein [Magnetovibrio sp.]
IETIPAALQIIFRNLISNAMKHHHKQEGVIKVQYEAAKAEHIFSVLDDGPGIPNNKRDDVFKPFVRLDASRNSGTGGVGLGMTIARDAMRSHGGEITLEDAPGGGLRVRLSLPV